MNNLNDNLNFSKFLTAKDAKLEEVIVIQPQRSRSFVKDCEVQPWISLIG